jgi:hypothetical protein
VALLVLVGLSGSTVFLMRQEWQAFHYPGAVPIPERTDVSLRRQFLRLNNGYRSGDTPRQVYDWYKNGFDLIPSGETAEACLVLEKVNRQLIFERTTSVLICDRAGEQLIFVTRITAFQ